MKQSSEFVFVSLSANALKQLKKNANVILALGISFLVLGTLALVYAYTSTLISMYFIGGLMVAAGILHGAKSFSINKWGAYLVNLVLSVLYILSGIFIIFYPVVNAATLTLLLAIFFVVSGLLKILFTFIYQVPHRFWMCLNGALGILLGVLIWQQWPASGMWVLGTFLGIDMIFTGWGWIMLATKVKHIK